MHVHRTFYITIQANIPTILVGPNGIGKTSVVFKLAETLERELVVFLLMGARPEDVCGYPSILERDGQKVAVLIPNEKLHKLSTTKNSIVLFDELNRADNEVQNVLAQIVDGKIGQFNLPNEFGVIATMNAYDIAGINELNYNIVSRFAQYEARVDSREELQAIMSGKYDISSEFKKIPDDYMKHSQSVRARLAGFYKFREKCFVGKPEGAAASKPWANPRTREKLFIPAMSAALAVGYNSISDWAAVAQACLGDAFSKDFQLYLSGYKFLPLQDVIDAINRNIKIPVSDVPVLITALTEVYHFIQSNVKIDPKNISTLARKFVKWLSVHYMHGEQSFPEIVCMIVNMLLNELPDGSDIAGPIPQNIAEFLSKLKGSSNV